MVNREYLAMLDNKSVIRELSEYATARGKEIGYENVFDYSLGNPSVPAPDSYRDISVRLLQEEEPLSLHGYNPTMGDPRVKEKVADSLNKRFGMSYTAGHIFPTSGAAGAIAHAIRCVTEPGEEIMVFAPYFSEYVAYINGAGAKIRVVPIKADDFQINFEAADAIFNEKTAAVLINTPNNPSGAVYSEETLTRLAEVLTQKSAQYGHTIFLISDEPYREIVFDGKKQAYPAKFYPHTLTCYSFSKSVCGEVLSPHADLLLLLQVPLRARRACRLRSGITGLRAGRQDGRHDGTDLPRPRPQLPFVPAHAGGGLLP